MSVVFYNGQFLPEEEAKVPYNDRGLLFGDGVFTSIRVQDGRAEWLEKHFERLFVQCEMLHIQPAEISEKLVEKLIQMNRAEKGVWRLKIVVTGGCVEGLNLKTRLGTVLMFLSPYTIPSAPLTLCLYPEPIERPLSKLKTLAYLDRLWVKEYATQKGCDDAIVRSREGYLLETAFANLFWKLGEKFFTPKIDQPLLAGITLRGLMQEVPFEQVLVKQVPSEAQLYLCNSLMGVCPATVICS